MSQPLLPGDPTPVSGQYQIIDPKFGKQGEITSLKFKPLPPTPKPNQTYQLVVRRT